LYRARHGWKETTSQNCIVRIREQKLKLLGPDESNFKGQGFLSQIEPTFKFNCSFESLPAQVGNIVSSLQVDNGENRGTKVWDELVKAAIPVSAQ